VFTVEYISRIGVIKTGNAVEQAGFTGPVWADNRGDQPRFDAQVHTGQSVQTTERERDIRYLQSVHGIPFGPGPYRLGAMASVKTKKGLFSRPFFPIQMSGTNFLVPVGFRLKVIALNDIAQ
jgi:hypothetical protein